MILRISYARHLFAGLALAFVALAPAFAAGITGRVVSASGAPLADATIFVHDAAPLTGSATLCPSCYPDCGKRVRSDASGAFTLPPISDKLRFRLMVVAKDHVPKFVPGITGTSPALDISLEPRPAGAVPTSKIARGRIVDSAGKPVQGAVVQVAGAAYGKRHRYGGLNEIDVLAATDEAGEFALAARDDAEALFARVSARTFANQTVELELGQTRTITLDEGATLTGRVMSEGQPLAHVALGLAPENRAAGSFVGQFETSTDEEGRFAFYNVPSRKDYVLHGKMDTASHGSIASRRVRVGAVGSTSEVGDLSPSRAHRIAGRIVLADREPVPTGGVLLLAHRETNDQISVPLNADGTFELGAIPGGTFTLGLRQPGYLLSSKNGSYSELHRRLIGQVRGDIERLEILIEKGEPFHGKITISPNRAPYPPRPDDKPLRGVETR